jgi:hypothetical protein
MRAAVMFVVSLSCAGCMIDVENTTDEKPATAEHQEAVSGFTSTIKLGVRLRSRDFSVPRGGAVSVTAIAQFGRPARCPRAYSVTLLDLIGSGRLAIETDVGPARTYPVGSTHTETWNRLDGGAYRLLFDTTTTMAECELRGGVTVRITP